MKPVLIGQIIDEDSGAVLVDKIIREMDFFVVTESTYTRFDTHISFITTNSYINEMIRQRKEADDGR